MKILKQELHQGDVQFYAIDKIDANLKKVDKQFIAASERSGSFHALFGNYDMYETDDGFVLDVKEECILNHSLKEHLMDKQSAMDIAIEIPKKDHRHSVVKPGKYFVGIQQRFDPLSAMKQKVQD